MAFSSFGNIACNNSACPLFFHFLCMIHPFLDVFFPLYLTSGV